MPRGRLSQQLPDFPWDSIAEAKARAASHPDGMIDLSVGSPVDPVSPVIRNALAEVSEFGGYPATAGTSELRAAIVSSLHRRYGVDGLSDCNVLPTVGSKEAIGTLPFLLNLGEGDVVAIPELAYPTYEVAARFVGAEVVRADAMTQLGPTKPALIFLNSPANPHGQVFGVDHMRKVLAYGREVGAVVASDECYLGLSWDVDAVSVLDSRVNDGDLTGLLAIHSLSKTSNLASYRAGFIAGDPALVGELLAVRKQAGLNMPFPVQTAMTAALSDDDHEEAQREVYRRRRTVLAAGVTAAGFSVDYSQGGLYLWVTRGEGCRATLDWCAERGVLAAPGDFYGPRGAKHLRLALTSSDESIERAVDRLI